MAEPTVVLLPVGVDDDALDACLAALDACTPAGTRVWLADDAQAGPRGYAVIERWIARTSLQADYTRRPRSIGQVAHLDEMLTACGDADVIVLAPDAIPTPGWSTQLLACFARDASIATATPWCNAGETASWPRCGEIAAIPGSADAVDRIARAASAMPPVHPELPAAVDHAVLLRGRARHRAGGLDAASYASWYAALIDLSLRLSGLGWRNALCETAFVARGGEGGPADGDLDALAARWPRWHARLAEFLMHDPLIDTRLALGRRHAALEPALVQSDLFAQPSPAQHAAPSSTASSAPQSDSDAATLAASGAPTSTGEIPSAALEGAPIADTASAAPASLPHPPAQVPSGE